ncbi:N-acetylmuramoyl-L-alanine amidase [Oceanobacillus sp. Castelsardo]|uniref:N-acetylmuramoyl-L-alanine amidase n=1 Tax=Oceanobacillus sp. Castelsardo TaxID=1851204 RepID=UPI0008385719|nr:N-acetylmuramoyl-L-alanine amidase [Oceanobacillus sp. Castelsardo]
MRPLRPIITIGFILLLLLIPITGYAESGKTYEVSTGVLNVRSEPSLQADILGMLTKGNQVNVFKEQYGWVQTYYQGKEAWIAKHHLIALDETQVSEVKQTAVLSAEMITLTADGVNIRSGPGEEYRVIGTASSHKSYELIHTEGDWHKISLTEGKTAWVASWLTNKSIGTKSRNNEETKTESKTLSPTNQSGSLSGRHIVLDPGHGGRDPGSIGLGGIYEKSLTSPITNRVADRLRNAGAKVTITREGDYYVSLEQRAAISNSHQTDAFISLHFNAYPILSAQGISTFYFSESGQQLAKNVQASLSSKVSLHNRGIHREGYHVLRNTSAPAILIELGFITNPYDLNIIQTVDYEKQAAEAITSGLIDFLN